MVGMSAVGMRTFVYVCDVSREASVDLLKGPEALFEAAREGAEWCVSRIRQARLKRAYITGEGVVVEYLVEYQHGVVLARVVFARDPAKALEEAEGAIATAEAIQTAPSWWRVASG